MQMLILSWYHVEIALSVKNFPRMPDVSILLLIYKGVDWFSSITCEKIYLILGSVKYLLNFE